MKWLVLNHSKLIRVNLFNLSVRQKGPRSFVFYFSVLILSLSLNYCSAGLASRYDSDYTLTEETAKANSSSLTVKVPSGWFAAEDNKNNLIDLWLIKDDYSATLNFIPMNLDSGTVKQISSDEINSLIDISQTFRRAGYASAVLNFSNREVFDINKMQFGAYEYVDNAKRTIRVAVFKAGNKYFELSAVPVKMSNLSELFKIQNSVLSSIQ